MVKYNVTEKNNNYKIQILNVSDNNLMDCGINIILENLPINSSLLILNFNIGRGRHGQLFVNINVTIENMYGKYWSDVIV